MRVVLAVPTIAARAHRLDALAHLWRSRSPEAHLEIIYSDAGSTWAAGLNDVWQQVRDDPPAILVLGSDDMVPADERWLPNAAYWIDEHAAIPAPRVEDPRFTNCGGYTGPVAEGVPADMTAFLIIPGSIGDTIFPLPDDLHYFADNLACVLLTRAGWPIVTSPHCRILHLHAPEGRGAGYGTENTRLYIDTVRYTRALDELGIDRATLPEAQRGGMWEERFLEIGRDAGG